MRNLILISVLILVFNGCNKEETQSDQNQIPKHENKLAEQEVFSVDLNLYDDSHRNSATVKIASTNEDLLDEFLLSYNIELEVLSDVDFSQGESNFDPTELKFTEGTSDSGIVIDIVDYEIDSNIKTVGLKITRESKKLKGLTSETEITYKGPVGIYHMKVEHFSSSGQTQIYCKVGFLHCGLCFWNWAGYYETIYEADNLKYCKEERKVGCKIKSFDHSSSVYNIYWSYVTSCD